jgi:dTDP-4-dehydrorhamnose reductase
LHIKNADIGIPIKVVSDQVGCPTSIFSLSKVCWEILYLNTPSIMHWSDAGCASWYDFAFLIGEISRDLGLIQNKSFIEPIKSHQLKTKALRPYYSLLDCYETYEILGYKANNWQIELQKVVEYLLVNNPKSF